MGVLRAFDPEIIVNEDGTETIVWLEQGMVVNGVMLGDPIELDGNPLTAEWDDPAFPNATIDKDGKITPDEEPELD
jgi:hypothetical protein